MRNTTLFAAILAAMLALGLQITSAHATLRRTWVSGTAIGGNPCTRAAPCNTFAAALSQTAAGGEINCLDQGEFGGVVITKAVTIDCTGVRGAADSSCTTLNGSSDCDLIIVQAAATDVVILRGLLLDRADSLVNNAIRFISGGALHVENCVISGYNTASPLGGPGNSGMAIFVNPSDGVTVKLYVQDTTISSNGLSSSGGGIVIQPVGSGSARVELNRVAVENNTFGIFGNGTGSTGLIAVQIKDSVVSGSVFNGISAFTAAGHSTTSITVDRSSSLLSGADGILAQGQPAFVILGGSTVSSNVTGLHAVSSGSIFSYQNNQLSGNVTDGAPTAVLGVK
jgi:hypothetical protein